MENKLPILNKDYLRNLVHRVVLLICCNTLANPIRLLSNQSMQEQYVIRLCKIHLLEVLRLIKEKIKTLDCIRP